MTRVISTAESFADHALEGFVDIYRQTIRLVPGGVVRRQGTRPGNVAVVVGGGSGHYPAFAGYVGTGLANGAAMGDVFASPAVSRVVSVAREASGGAGVLLTYGSYAGDRLNFREAARQMGELGIETASVEVTDDIASAPRGEEAARRGVAGDLVVFKVAGAAAERGDSLNDTAALARRANDRTRTLGVAFAGCTLPGSASPLFDVPQGRMALGMGVHGEPGLAELDSLSAPRLAKELVGRVLEEAPDDSNGRVAVVLNGLGSTKYEELFGLWRWIRAEFKASGMNSILPLVGEYVTSLDMAGCSLTISWLDDDLETCWVAEADAPGLHRGPVSNATLLNTSIDPDEVVDGVSDRAPQTTTRVQPASEGELASAVVEVLEAMATRLRAAEHDLGALDSVAGDGDHGQGMSRGSAAAAAAASAALHEGQSAADVLRAGAAAWGERAGGTSGMLWNAGLAAAAGHLSERSYAAAEATEAALLRVQELGGAKVGDKTLVDALAPFAGAVRTSISSGANLPDVLALAATAADDGARSTANFQASMGRARAHAENSLGHPDPGAVSFAMCCEELLAVVLRRWQD